MNLLDSRETVDVNHYNANFLLGISGIVHLTTGNPGSVIVPQYGSSKITVFVWGKNIILKFLENTK